MSGDYDYSNPQVQEDMEKLLTAMENTTYIDPTYTESWLRALLDYVDRWKDYPGSNLDITDEQSFIKTLQEVKSTLFNIIFMDMNNHRIAQFNPFYVNFCRKDHSSSLTPFL